jgi:hypothetical protein
MTDLSSIKEHMEVIGVDGVRTPEIRPHCLNESH